MGSHAIAHGATLAAALTLAQAGSVTSVELAAQRQVRVCRAARYLALYCLRGYLVRIRPGAPWSPAVYAITEAGVARLIALQQRAAMPHTLNPFAALEQVMCYPFATGATAH